MRERKTQEEAASWTFLSNHAHVLLLIAQDPEVKLREVADRVGITERAVQKIVADLEAARYLERERAGRRNRYKVHPELPLRHPVEAHRDVGALIDLVMPSRGGHEDPPRRPGTPGGERPDRPLAPAKAKKHGKGVTGHKTDAAGHLTTAGPRPVEGNWGRELGKGIGVNSFFT